ncbi:hypothetical protein D3C78_865090 [compost metagenome]
MRIRGNGDDIGHSGYYPAEPVSPAGKIARPRSEQIGGKIAKRFVLEIREQQFTHCPHHEEKHKTDDHIDEYDRWPGKADGFTRPHKQPGANGTADGDKLNMTVCEIAPQRLFRRSLFIGDDFYLIYHVIFLLYLSVLFRLFWPLMTSKRDDP